MDLPVILDLDRSVLATAPASRIDLTRWHTAIRLGCSQGQFRRFANDLDSVLPTRHGPVLLGSGDFHHVTRALVARRPEHGLRVIVFDNHPDNMRFPFGIHCGSWVRDVAMMPHVSHVHMIGMTSADMRARHCWEHRMTPLIQRKLTYWTLGAAPRWLARMGLAHANCHFDSPDALIAAFEASMGASPAQPTYLSIDKDVLHDEEVTTNWDQGDMRMTHLMRAIAALRGQVVAADITGEISHVRYPQRWKRVISALDGQTAPIQSDELAAHQSRQGQCNLALLAALSEAMSRTSREHTLN